MDKTNEANSLIRKQLGENIRKRRLEKGMTQLELADAAGFSEEHCKQVEYGNRALSIYNLCSVAKILGVSTDYLLYGSTIQTETENIIKMLCSLPPVQLHRVEKLISIALEISNDRTDSV